MGTEGGPCYGNSTCNSGLKCLSGLCVKVPVAAYVPPNPNTKRDEPGCSGSASLTPPAWPLALLALGLFFSRRRGGCF